jgi:hypothetical protein
MSTDIIQAPNYKETPEFKSLADTNAQFWAYLDENFSGKKGNLSLEERAVALQTFQNSRARSTEGGVTHDGVSVSYGNHENMEGSFYISDGDDEMRHRRAGDHGMYFNGKETYVHGKGADINFWRAEGDKQEISGKMGLLLKKAMEALEHRRASVREDLQGESSRYSEQGEKAEVTEAINTAFDAADKLSLLKYRINNDPRNSSEDNLREEKIQEQVERLEGALDQILQSELKLSDKAMLPILRDIRELQERLSSIEFVDVVSTSRKRLAQVIQFGRTLIGLASKEPEADESERFHHSKGRIEASLDSLLEQCEGVVDENLDTMANDDYMSKFISFGYA